jgi:hypothetical protein
MEPWVTPSNKKKTGQYAVYANNDPFIFLFKANIPCILPPPVIEALTNLAHRLLLLAGVV